MAPRNHSLDGLRGCLAVFIVAHHSLLTLGNESLTVPARLAVCAFFTLSACVLTRSWDGRYGLFLIRRLLRLWPTYALCLFAGGIMHREAVPLHWYAWFPVVRPMEAPLADVPIWSLAIEAWAMLFMPVFVWVARRSDAWLIVAIIAPLVFAAHIHWAIVFSGFFIAGARWSRFTIRWAPLETAIPRWLGRISYPLYLCHWPIIWFLGLPLWATIPLSFGVATILSETIEKWSIGASRHVGRLKLQSHGAKSNVLQSS